MRPRAEAPDRYPATTADDGLAEDAEQPENQDDEQDGSDDSKTEHV